MTETLLQDPVVAYHKTSLRRLGQVVERAPLDPIGALNLTILRVHTALQADQAERIAEAHARGLSESELGLVRKCAGAAINFGLIKMQMPAIGFDQLEQ